MPEPTRLGEIAWLEPYPDVLLEGLADSTPGPEARYEATAMTRFDNSVLARFGLPRILPD